MENKLPTISIITVCRNSEKYLEQCIQSVVSQTYRDIEYIVIDGGSNDRTLDIIKKYKNKITRWISEPDNGIYDAMNKGNELANGDYILFLNSDDYLYSKNSVRDAVKIGCSQYTPLLIIAKANVAIDDEVLSQACQGICHQATLIHKSIYKKVPYALNFKIAGDYEYWLKLRKLGLFRPKHIDLVVTIFRLGGTSTRDIKSLFLRYAERENINRYYNGYNLVQYCLVLIKDLFVIVIKLILELIFGKKAFYKKIYYPVLNLVHKKVM
jgi:glycosyltransferase involved in cell wall biosynthesis